MRIPRLLKIIAGYMLLSVFPSGGVAQNAGTTIEFADSSFWVDEDHGTTVITVVRSGDVSGTMSVDYLASDDFALAGIDFEPSSGTLDFESGETEATFEIDLIDDSIPEGSEPIALTLSNPTNQGTLGSQSNASLWITDNERRGTLLDTGFEGAVQPLDYFQDLEVLPNGKILAVGVFTDPATGVVDRVVRFNTDGSRDTSFDMSDAAPNGIVAVLTVLPDGKAMIAGNFTQIGNDDWPRIARLNPDGSVDNTFSPGTGPMGNSPFIFEIKRLPDGKLLLGGAFDGFDDVNFGHLVRLNADGSLDTNFGLGNGIVARGTTVQTPWIAGIDLQSDGKIVIGGNFTEVDDLGNRHIARLHDDGTVDANFFAGRGAEGPSAIVETVAALDDGRVLIGGNFQTIDGARRNGIARLNADGSLDTSFDPGDGIQTRNVNREMEPGMVEEIHVLTDGRILLTGTFDLMNAFGRPGIGRLLEDGKLDSSFGPYFGTTYRDASGYLEFERVTAVDLMDDGKVVTGAIFETAEGDLQTRLSRLLDTNVTANTVEFDVAQISVSETGPSAEIEVIRRGISAEPFTVQYAVTDGTAKAGVDFQATDGTLQFESLETVKTITIPIHSDSIAESKETFHLELRNPSEPVTVAEPSRATIEIIEGSAPGMIDLDFAAITLPRTVDMVNFPPVTEIEVLDNGQILVAGFFGAVNDVQAAGLFRAHPDGTIDESFQAEVPDGDLIVEFRKMDVLSNGDILGGFRGVSLLKPDGARDHAFTPSVNFVTTLITQPDGSFLINDLFRDVNRANEVNEVIRFHPDGSQDSTFRTTNLNDWAMTGVVQRDGKIVIGGWFTEVNGISQNRLVRLNQDGIRDAFFDIGTGIEGSGPTVVISVIEQPDGKLIVGGQFNLADGEPYNNIARLNVDGSLDTSFDPGLAMDAWVESLALQEDGKILVGGGFSNVNGMSRPGFARLHADGSLDETFVPDLTYQDIGEAVVTAIAVQADGQILIGGSFIEVNGLSRPGFARIHGGEAGGDSVIEPPVLTLLSPGDAGAFRFEFTAQPGVTYAIEGTKDLNQWDVVSTLVADSETVTFEDQNAATTPFRFFRVVSP